MAKGFWDLTWTYNLSTYVSKLDSACLDCRLAVFAKEWLGLTTGWSSTELCHHCRVTHTAFAVAPSILDELPRRTLHEIQNSCTHRGIRSTASIYVYLFMKRL